MFEKVRVVFRRIPKHVWILAVIILIGIFFRTYHFHDWLSFKGDGFRDAIMISNAYRVGPESLPLLGPRAAGTMLRLGPVFYYFQYASASLFDSMSAPVLAYPDLLFSILALPLFYFFSRRYFSIPWSLAMAGMLSTSFLAIEYGRFAWNPNAAIFFVLLFSFALLKISDTDPKEARFKSLWAIVAGVALAIASQLHFSAFLGLPIVLVLFLLWRWRNTMVILSWKIIFFFMVSVLLVYTPVFFSEYFKHGENTRQFLKALESKPSVHGMTENIIQVAYTFANQSARIMLGIVDAGKKAIVLSGGFLLLGFLANLYLIRRERDPSRQNFLRLTLLLITTYLILYAPLAFTVDRPRFFLPFMAVFYVYCGYIIVALETRFGTRMILRGLAVVGVSVVILSNMHSTLTWFSELRQSEEMTEIAGTDNIKGRGFWLVWIHFERAAKVMTKECQNVDDPIFFFSSKRTSAYSHSIEYALSLMNPNRPIIAERKYDPVVLEGCYFFVSLPYDDPMPELITREPADTPMNLGGIQVTRIYPVQMSGIYDEDDEKETVFTPEKRTKNSRVYWGDIINLFKAEYQ